jgi:hypothetical protein
MNLKFLKYGIADAICNHRGSSFCIGRLLTFFGKTLQKHKNVQPN